MNQQLPLTLDPDKPPRQKREAALVSFHARAHVGVQEALDGEQRAARQKERVLALFRERACRMTPYDVAEALGICINSARRSCTDLAKEGLLVHWKGDRRPAGPWGQRSGTWSAA